jgi:hypothetical protein
LQYPLMWKPREGNGSRFSRAFYQALKEPSLLPMLENCCGRRI